MLYQDWCERTRVMENVGRRAAIGLVLFFAVLPGHTLGQGLSGSLSGSVKDEQGGRVMLGARLHLGR